MHLLGLAKKYLAVALGLTVAAILAVAPAAQDSAGGQDMGKGDDEQAAPRRKIPKSKQEELEYKLLRVQQDPFLTPDSVGMEIPGFYNPSDWLNPSPPSDLCTYLVQGKKGEVLGYMSMHTQTGDDPEHGPVCRITLSQSFEPPVIASVVVDANTLKPVSSERSLMYSATQANPSGGPGSAGTALNPMQNLPSIRTRYLFDRVTVKQESGGFITRRRFRQLPYSYERDSIYLILRQLKMQKLEWPFEAALTDPSAPANLPLSIAKPKRVAASSAEPRQYNCFEMHVRIGNEENVFYVERISPHRLIKFTLGGLQYTLFSYSEQE